LLMSDYNEPVNIGNPDEVTMLELAKEIKAMVPGSKSEIVFKPLPQDDPQVRQPDITLAKSLLGWKPTVERRVGLEKTIKYFREALQ
jgi:dTDP-glucose 4,6-dehydratase